MATANESPVGRRAVDGSADRAARSDVYRAARAEYAAVRELRKVDAVAAQMREQRYETDLTQR